jgi:hypothetical protein
LCAGSWRRIKHECKLDHLIAFPHWGTEDTFYPRPDCAAQAAQLGARGFDCIVGHGPHVLQSVETFGAAVCAHSIGNLCYGKGSEQTKFSGAFSLLLDSKGARSGYQIDVFALLCNGRLDSVAATSVDVAWVLQHEVANWEAQTTIRDRVGSLFDFQHQHLREMLAATARYRVRVEPHVPEHSAVTVALTDAEGRKLGPVTIHDSDAGTILLASPFKFAAFDQARVRALYNYGEKEMTVNSVSILDLDTNDETFFDLHVKLENAEVSAPRAMTCPGPLLSYLECKQRAPFKTGDVLAMRAAQLSADIITAATKSKYSHVGIIAVDPNSGEPLLYEATSNSDATPDISPGRIHAVGLFCCWLSERIATYSGLMDWFPLREPLGAEEEKKIVEYLRRNHLRRVPYDYMQMLRRGLKIDNKEDGARIFCSELVACALRVAGRLPPDADAADQTPADIVAMPIFGPPTNLKVYDASKRRCLGVCG